jgi:signal transduction histidine kinase
MRHLRHRLHHRLHHRVHHRPPGCPPHGFPRHRGPARLWRARAQLRWRIFFWFGAAIVISGLAAGGILDLSDGHAHTIALIVAGVILWLSAGAIAWSLTRPLMSIVRVTRELGAGKLDSRLELGRHSGELGVLADAVNDMAARIERQVADQRELLAAVSHELRTPLGHARILLDTARDRGTDPALVDGLEREIVELDALVGQLLATSRLEFEVLERRRVDGAEAAARALDRAGLPAELLEVVAGDTGCDADPTLLARALANILRNAQEHGNAHGGSARGGATRLRLRREGEALAFEVDDAGPGFAAEDLERVFERFYRGERRAGGSLGLGLSLVRRIAQAHDGRAWAENLPAGGARVGFTIGPAGLPRSSQGAGP